MLYRTFLLCWSLTDDTSQSTVRKLINRPRINLQFKSFQMPFGRFWLQSQHMLHLKLSPVSRKTFSWSKKFEFYSSSSLFISSVRVHRRRFSVDSDCKSDRNNSIRVLVSITIIHKSVYQVDKLLKRLLEKVISGKQWATKPSWLNANVNKA